MRDDFTKVVKATIAARAGHRCSRPECGAFTSGPQIEPNKVLSVGVAAHITAAAEGGARYAVEISTEDRRSVGNAIWLCQTCAKLIDNDPARFDVSVLGNWKRQAEANALTEIGKARSSIEKPSAITQEREIRRGLRMRGKIENALLRPLEERRAMRPPWRPYEKFRKHKIVIRSLDDGSYPYSDTPLAGRISSWFEIELYDFYHGGIQVITALRLAAIDEDGNWGFVEYGTACDETQYRLAKVWSLGCIPWRNIREVDPRGDSDYPGAHLFCAFRNNGTPYEEFMASEVGEDYDWPLDPRKQRTEII